MMKIINKTILLISAVILLGSFAPGENSNISGIQDNSIQWIDFESAEVKGEMANKKYFVYVYTDWCGYCKKLKSSTFQDKEVISLLNEKFIPIMFNAESKEPVTFKGNEFNFVANGRRGYHELAAALLNNQLSYPTLVFLDEKMNMIQPLPGYKSAEDLKIILKFLGDNIYENMTFEEYYNQEKEG